MGYASPSTAADQHPLLSAAAAPTLHQTHSSSEKLKIQNYSVESGKTISIPTVGLEKFLAMNPQPVSITSQGPYGEMVVEGKQLGSTLILLWEPGGVRSIRITVTSPKAEIEIREKMARESSPLYQSQKKRAFRFFYDTRYSFNSTGLEPSSLSEERRVGDHQMAFKGLTPGGELKGNLMMEYRKDANTDGSVTMPMDSKIGLYHTTLPHAQGLDVVGGTQFVSGDSFGFPGARLLGVSLAPSSKRLENGAARSLHPFFFIGQERDGSTIDSPAGIRNRKLKNRFAGAGAHYFLWDQGKISTATYHRWSGPETTQADNNLDTKVDFGRGPVRFTSEVGLDNKQQVAFNSQLFLNTKNFSIENHWVNVKKDYKTVTGSTAGGGQIGYALYAGWLPPDGNVRIYLDSSLMRNRTSPSEDPRYKDDYTKAISPRLEWSTPDGATVQLRSAYEDNRSSSSPSIRKRLESRYSKDFYIQRYYLNSFQWFTSANLESFRKSVDALGANGNRSGVSIGINLRTLSGLSFLVQPTIYKISEKDPTPPRGRTYPGEFIFQVDYGRQLKPLPGNFNMSVRYTNERDTFNKVLQPFLQQDRVEGNAGLYFRLSPESSVFIDSRMVKFKSIVGEGRGAEFSLVIGLRTSLLSPIRVLQKGKIEGFVFKDVNANGLREPDEPGLAGFEVSIPGGPSKKTEANGAYRLRVKEGKWLVSATGKIPEGWFFSTVNHQAIELLPGESHTVNFGVSAQIQVRGRAYLDLNHNHFFDAGDIPMPGIEVTMASGQRGRTSGDGLYSIFRVLPGPNRTSLDLDVLPSGYRTLSPTEKSFEADAGDTVTYDIVLAAERIISGVVFDDKNQDGSQGNDERGQSGIAVSAGGYKSVTNREGRFFIRNLEPGALSVTLDQATLPSGYQLASPPYNIDIPTEPLMRQDLFFAIRRSSDDAV